MISPKDNMSQAFIAKLGHPSVHETFTTVSWCHTLFVPKADCPNSCTKLYQEQEKVPSLENASTTPMMWVNKIVQIDPNPNLVNDKSTVIVGFQRNQFLPFF